MRKSCKIWNACSEVYGGGEDLPPCTKESTDTQQLKAKIAEIIDKYERLERVGSLNWYGIAHDLMKKFRQLSAV